MLTVALSSAATLVTVGAVAAWIHTDNGMPWSFALWVTTAAAVLWAVVVYYAI